MCVRGDGNSRKKHTDSSPVCAGVFLRQNCDKRHRVKVSLCQDFYNFKILYTLQPVPSVTHGDGGSVRRNRCYFLLRYLPHARRTPVTFPPCSGPRNGAWPRLISRERSTWGLAHCAAQLGTRGLSPCASLGMEKPCVSSYRAAHAGDIPAVSAARHVMNVPAALRDERCEMGPLSQKRAFVNGTFLLFSFYFSYVYFGI